MSNALVHSNGTSSLAQFGEMTVQNIVDRKRKMAEVMEAVMIDGTHYGRIPGCGDKPSLFKAGAEVAATVFGLAPTFKITRGDLPGGHREYEITCTLVHIATGAIVGEGVGCCSTMESKYRWRKAERKCPNCSQSAIIKGKAEYGGGWLCYGNKGGCGAKWKDGAKEIEDQQTGRAENPDIADTYNTVLKIAKKRAQVDAILTATGASDILTQDLEDLPPGSVIATQQADDIDQRPPQQQTQRANGSSNGNSRQAPQPPVDEDELEEIAVDLIADIQQAESEQSVRALAPRFGKLPKGTKARQMAADVYNQRLDSFSGRVAS